MLSNRDRRSLPSYISARSFAQALIGVLVPDPAGTTTMDRVRIELAALPDPALRTALEQLATQAENDIATFRIGIEHWYDDQMDRVSGWYKRHVRWISLAIGVLLILVFNLNAVTIARTLYTDEALRGAVVSKAAEAADCSTKEPAVCLDDMRAEVSTIRGSGLPVGWHTVPECDAGSARTPCNWAQTFGFTDPPSGVDTVPDASFLLTLVTGWALMGVALLPGARFWFDALSRLGTLRASGPKPNRAVTPS